jgi:hypothetical protein
MRASPPMMIAINIRSRIIVLPRPAEKDQDIACVPYPTFFRGSRTLHYVH